MSVHVYVYFVVSLLLVAQWFVIRSVRSDIAKLEELSGHTVLPNGRIIKR